MAGSSISTKALAPITNNKTKAVTVLGNQEKKALDLMFSTRTHAIADDDYLYVVGEISSGDVPSRLDVENFGTIVDSTFSRQLNFGPIKGTDSEGYTAPTLTRTDANWYYFFFNHDVSYKDTKLRLAKINAQTGELASDFAILTFPTSYQHIYDIKISEQWIYVCGTFKALDDGDGVLDTAYIARLDKNTGKLDRDFINPVSGNQSRVTDQLVRFVYLDDEYIYIRSRWPTSAYDEQGQTISSSKGGVYSFSLQTKRLDMSGMLKFEEVFKQLHNLIGQPAQTSSEFGRYGIFDAVEDEDSLYIAPHAYSFGSGYYEGGVYYRHSHLIAKIRKSDFSLDPTFVPHKVAFGTITGFDALSNLVLYKDKLLYSNRYSGTNNNYTPYKAGHLRVLDKNTGQVSWTDVSMQHYSYYNRPIIYNIEEELYQVQFSSSGNQKLDLDNLTATVADGPLRWFADWLESEDGHIYVRMSTLYPLNYTWPSDGQEPVSTYSFSPGYFNKISLETHTVEYKTQSAGLVNPGFIQSPCSIIGQDSEFLYCKSDMYLETSTDKPYWHQWGPSTSTLNIIRNSWGADLVSPKHLKYFRIRKDNGGIDDTCQAFNRLIGDIVTSKVEYDITEVISDGDYLYLSIHTRGNTSKPLYYYKTQLTTTQHIDLYGNTTLETLSNNAVKVPHLLKVHRTTGEIDTTFYPQTSTTLDANNLSWTTYSGLISTNARESQLTVIDNYVLLYHQGDIQTYYRNSADYQNGFIAIDKATGELDKRLCWYACLHATSGNAIYANWTSTPKTTAIDGQTNFNIKMLAGKSNATGSEPYVIFINPSGKTLYYSNAPSFYPTGYTVGASDVFYIKLTPVEYSALILDGLVYRTSYDNYLNYRSTQTVKSYEYGANAEFYVNTADPSLTPRSLFPVLATYSPGQSLSTHGHSPNEGLWLFVHPTTPWGMGQLRGYNVGAGTNSRFEEIQRTPQVAYATETYYSSFNTMFKVFAEKNSYALFYAFRENNILKHRLQIQYLRGEGGNINNFPHTVTLTDPKLHQNIIEFSPSKNGIIKVTEAAGQWVASASIKNASVINANSFPSMSTPFTLKIRQTGNNPVFLDTIKELYPGTGENIVQITGPLSTSKKGDILTLKFSGLGYQQWARLFTSTVTPEE